MGYSDLASLAFTVRSADKTASGDIGRAPVTLVQGASVIKAVQNYQNPFSKAIKKGLQKVSSDETVKKIAKVTNFAADHVNYLIALSSGLKVAMADKEERTNTLIAETGCFTGMILGEGWMKKNLNKYLDQLKIDKKWIPIIKGIVFVTGSISCSTLGEKLGKKIAQYWNKPLVDKKEEQKVNNKETYEPLNIKA
jgi:hypothetical protein